MSLILSSFFGPDPKAIIPLCYPVKKMRLFRMILIWRIERRCEGNKRQDKSVTEIAEEDFES